MMEKIRKKIGTEWFVLCAETDDSQLWESIGSFRFFSRVSEKTTIFSDWQDLYRGASKLSWQGEQLRKLIAIHEAKKEGITPEEWFKKIRRRLEDQLRKNPEAVFLAYSVLRDA
jgi:hypothetical protein